MRLPADPAQLLRLETLAAHRVWVHARLATGMALTEGPRSEHGVGMTGMSDASGVTGAAGEFRLNGETESARVAGSSGVAGVSGLAAPGTAARSGDQPAALWMSQLRTPTRYATPDLLLRAPDGGYVPVLVRGHRTTDPGSGAVCSRLAAPLAAEERSDRKVRLQRADALALAHVHRLLEELGLASPRAWGGIIGRGRPASEPGWDDATVIVWYDLHAPLAGAGAASANGTAGRSPGTMMARSVLADYDARFVDRLAVARAAASGAPALARPSRIAECRRCPWWSVCGPELAAAHDISLLVPGSDVDVLHAAGIVTYDDLAAMDRAASSALPLTGIPPAEARTRALALLAGAPLVRRADRVAPPRADVELDVDMESYSDEGAYLWGTYLTGTPPPGWEDFRAGYRPFVTWEALASARTAENFVAFWRYLSALRRACAAARLTFAAYCYSHTAEERWIYGTAAAFPDARGMPGKNEIDAFCSSSQWVDLYLEIKRHFVVPGSLRLKRIATVAGFSWRDPEPGGENSMAWYRIAARRNGSGGGDGVAGSRDAGAPGPEAGAEGDDGAAAKARSGGGGGSVGAGGSGGAGADDIVQAHRDRILRYNEDDVRATLALRNWMTERAGSVPALADLERMAR